MLLLVAGCVWLAAGLSVMSVGISAGGASWTPWMLGAAFLVYVLFLAMFLSITRKHVKRITSYTETLTGIFKFNDTRSYIIMVVMIGLGLTVRLSGLVPDPIIAFFYCGLGTALLSAAIAYLVNYISSSRNSS